MTPFGQPCGSILWESKRTKNWSDLWLPKLREDQRTAKADVALIISSMLPKGVTSFDLVDGVWVADVRSAIPVAAVLRQSLVDLTAARKMADGQQTKLRWFTNTSPGSGSGNPLKRLLSDFARCRRTWRANAL
jgi:hypothetical protein